MSQTAKVAPRPGTAGSERCAEIYGVPNWGADYFFINKAGHLAVAPLKIPACSIDVHETVEKLREANLSTPLLLRFPQVLDERIAAIHGAFRNAIKEFEYEGRHLGVYPLKVNQKAEVVRRLVDSGRRYDYGLEVGSKAELLAALAAPLSDDALIVCNGLKDDLLLRMAILGNHLGRTVVLVVEDREDLERALDLGEHLGAPVHLGIRVKLYSRGSGKWEESGGEHAKFGMGTVAFVKSIELLRERGALDRLRMLHFHIGSQITDIRRAKQAFKEAARVYAKARKIGCPVEFLNVGGGLGVDYDGSRTASEFSVNYSVQEFANDVIYVVGEVCDGEEVPDPTIVTESGRAMTAHHAVLVAEVKKVIRAGGDGEFSLDAMESEAEPVVELIGLAREINAKNFREYYHDALQQREDLNTLFELGYLTLTDRARGEWLFWEICRRAAKLSRTQKQRPEELEELDRLLASKYIGNFSVFQSLPDSWAFDQLFPIMPIHRLNEAPSERGVLCDITCDSDGAIDNFVDIRDVKETLELHALRPGERYYVAFLLLGAYQETLGDLHNLFGAAHEVSVSVNPEGRTETSNVVRGDTVREVLEYTGHESEVVRKSLAQRLARRREAGLISADEEHETLAAASLTLDDGTYLT